MSAPTRTDVPWQLRTASGGDLAAVSALLTGAGLTLNAVESQFGPQFSVAVHRDTGAVIGAAGVELYRHGSTVIGLFRSAVVEQAWRGHGIGAALAADRIAWAEHEGLTDLYLLTETAADYWPRFGFAITDRAAAPAGLMESHEWKGGCPASAVAMRLTLPRVGAAS